MIPSNTLMCTQTHKLSCQIRQSKSRSFTLNVKMKKIASKQNAFVAPHCSLNEMEPPLYIMFDREMHLALIHIGWMLLQSFRVRIHTAHSDRRWELTRRTCLQRHKMRHRPKQNASIFFIYLISIPVCHFLMYCKIILKSETKASQSHEKLYMPKNW